LTYKLKDAGFKKGDQIIIQLTENDKFVIAIISCLISGFVIVPLNAGINEENLLKVTKVFNLLENPHILCDNSSYDLLKKYSEFNIKFSESLYLFEKIELFAQNLDFDNPEPSDTVIIQFSSGSTGIPKGAVVSHKNLITNINSMLQSLSLKHDEVFLSWAPLTHSSGLILTLMNALGSNSNLVLMDKQLFITNPLLWMVYVSKYNATLLFSPNFGFQYFLNALDKNKKYEWDLSSVRYILNGSEQISMELSRKFLEALEKYGLNSVSMTAIYGLAEATLAVSIGKTNEKMQSIIINRQKMMTGNKIEILKQSDINGIELVVQGKPIPGIEIRVTDDSNNNLDEGYIGNLQVKSNSIVSEYYGNSDETKDLHTEDGWLNTGDLAFINQKELIITGRKKDVIIINGINYFPIDIERIIAEFLNYDVSSFVATGVFDSTKGKEKVIIGFVNHDKPDFFDELSEKIKKNVLSKIGIEIDSVIQIDNIPKTLNGKIQRFKFKENFEIGLYVQKQTYPFLNTLEKKQTYNYCNQTIVNKHYIRKMIKNLATDISGISELNVKRGLIEQGFNSLMAIKISSKLSEYFNKSFPESLIFDYPSIDSISDYIISELNM
jgi:acyl-CoA synthetase (AMP-forming)/AMP-acid ligase II/acyl carrier protein